MIRLLMLAFLLVFLKNGFSQDTLVRNNGSVIICYIKSEDNNKIFFRTDKNGQDLETFISKEEIKTIKYKSAPVIHYNPDTIVRNNGKKIICNITKQDSSIVFFVIENKSENIETFLSKKEILEIRAGSVARKTFTYIDFATVSLGRGFDFGGLGGKLSFYPLKFLGIYGSVGSTLMNGVAYSAGVKLRLITSTRNWNVSPFILGMYGVNEIFIVENVKDLNKTFVGQSYGIGFDLRPWPKRKIGYFSFAIIIPVRGNQLKEYIDSLKNKYKIEITKEPSPINLSIGFNFIIN